jgi:PAS domain S-box-containing protein
MIDEKMIDKFMTIEKFLSELVGMRQEIADLKSSEVQGRLEIARLRENESQFRGLMDHAPQRMFVKGKNSAYLFGNGPFARDLNRGPSEVAGKSDYDLFPKEIAERFLCEDARILETGIPEESEFQYPTPAGERLMRMTKAPLRNPGGEIVAISGIFWDITEQRRAGKEAKQEQDHLQQLVADQSADLTRLEEQLRAETAERKRVETELHESIEERKKISEECTRFQEAEEVSRYKLRFIVDHLPVGVWITLDEQIVFANAKGLEDLGYSQEDLAARTFFDIIHPEDQRMVRERYAGWLSGKTPPNIFACRFVHKDGTVKWLENKIAPIQWEGKPGMVNFAVDITDRKWARGELRNSIDQFRSVVNSLEEILLTWDREKH